MFYLINKKNEDMNQSLQSVNFAKKIKEINQFKLYLRRKDLYPIIYKIMTF